MSTQLRERVMSDTKDKQSWIDGYRKGLDETLDLALFRAIDHDLATRQRLIIEKLQQQHAALLTAAKLAHGRLVASGGDAISINALNKAIGACHE